MGASSNGTDVTSQFGVAFWDLLSFLTSMQWHVAFRDPMKKTSGAKVSMPESVVQESLKNTKVVTTFWQQPARAARKRCAHRAVLQLNVLHRQTGLLRVSHAFAFTHMSLMCHSWFHQEHFFAFGSDDAREAFFKSSVADSAV